MIELAADGLSNKEIAAALYVAVNTVEVHLKRAYAKLGVRSRTQLSASQTVISGLAQAPRKELGFPVLACGRAGPTVRPMRDFVGERYLPASDRELATRWGAAAREAAEQLSREGTAVDYVRWIFIPEDETCIHVYRAESIEAERAAAARASLRLDRLAQALSDGGAAT